MSSPAARTIVLDAPAAVLAVAPAVCSPLLQFLAVLGDFDGVGKPRTTATQRCQLRKAARLLYGGARAGVAQREERGLHASRDLEIAF